MKTHYFICAITLLAAYLFPNALAAQDNFEIRKIKFEGNKVISDDDLLDAMIMHPSNFFRKRVSKEVPSLFHREMLETDIERLERSYHREGFMNASVRLADTKMNEKKERLDLLFEITEGEPYTIDSISFNTTAATPGLNADSVFQSLGKSLSLEKTMRFRDVAIGDDQSTIREAFKNNGYAYAQVSYQLQIIKEQKLVSIKYELDPGPKSYFGETVIDGNKHVSENYIRKQLVYEAGEPYDVSKLDETRKNMYRLQRFSVLSLQPQTTNDKNPNIPIRMYIDEAPRFTSKYGVGYGTEDKFRAFTELAYKGFMGRSRQLRLYLKHSALTPYQIDLKYIQPQFFTPDLSFTLNPFLGRFTEPGYDIKDLGFNVKFSDKITDDFSAQVNYYYEKVKNYDPDPEQDIEYSDIPYDKSGVLLSFLFDSSDPQFSPKKGLNVVLAYKLNGYWFGGDYDYHRLWTDVRQYQKIGDIVLASRIMVGSILSGKNASFVPVEDRYYVGGSMSVRGWQRSELGPIRENGTPSGGKSVVQGSFELRVPVVWRLSLVTFLDYGNVWQDEFSFPLNDLSYASGGGLRIDTPIGPIRFDVGVPIWNEKRSAEFFISVGQAF